MEKTNRGREWEWEKKNANARLTNISFATKSIQYTQYTLLCYQNVRRL